MARDEPGPRVRTSLGELRGLDAGNGVLRFAGIPFAAPPTGERRFRPPQPAEPWSGVRDASDFSCSAPQQVIPGGLGELIGIAPGECDEDCLYANVWTPALDGARRPVLVWVHGGGNTVGSGAQPRIDGRYLAERGDVVVVTFNYRLGAFGFLHVPELGGSGNEGLLDQVAALRFVRREIAAFGGDPRNVTVFGQSAGGFDIAQLMGLRGAAGAFDKAVPMSGSLSPQVSRAAASATARRFADRFGGFAKLRQAPVEEILELQAELTRERFAGELRFGPVCDGQVIPESAAVPIAEGRHDRGIPLLIGHTRDEFALFTAFDPRTRELDDAGLADYVRALHGEDTERVLDTYRKARAARGVSTDPRDVLDALMTDRIFRIPAIRTAELHAGHTPATWMYRFDHPSPALDGKLGSCHSIDIPFVFGTCGLDSMRKFVGEGDTVDALSQRVMDLYLAFARSGDPSTPALPDWPRYEPSTRATLLLDAEPRVERDPEREERELWESLDPR